MKRILSGIFAALLILCALPVAAFAEQQPSDIDPITVQPISASGGEIVRPTWLAYGPITQYPAEGGTWEYGFWDAKVRSYYTVDRCHGSIEWQYRSFGRYCRWGKVNRRKMGSSVAFAR